MQEQNAELFEYLYLLADFQLALLASASIGQNLAEAEEEVVVEQELLKLFKQLKREKIKNDLRDLAVAIKEAEQTGNNSRAETLLQQVNEKTVALTSLDSE